jgi:hypothetical protein
MSLTITSFTKIMSCSDKLSKDEFPAPPSKPSEFEFQLVPIVKWKASLDSGKLENEGVPLSGFGENGDKALARDIRMASAPPVWVPEGGSGEDRWKREVRFDTSFVLDCTPSFETKIISCRVCTFPPSIGESYES